MQNLLRQEELLNQVREKVTAFATDAIFSLPTLLLALAVLLITRSVAKLVRSAAQKVGARTLKSLSLRQLLVQTSYAAAWYTKLGDGSSDWALEDAGSSRFANYYIEGLSWLLREGPKVDGVYSADPKKDPAATRYDRLTYAEAINQRLRVMDLTALAMCEERSVPVLVFDFFTEGNIRRVVEGDTSVGTLLSGDEAT